MKLTATIVTGLLLCFAGAARADKSSPRTPSRSSMLGSAEHQVYFGADADFAMPVGNYSDINGVGGGLLLTAEYPVLEQLSATARVGFQFHLDKGVLGADAHVHSIPVLLGAKYYLLETNRQGLFAAAELGMFDLMTGVSAGGTSASQNDIKFGAGAGIGYSYEKWNARVNVHTHDVGHFGDAIMVTGGIGYQFAGL
jgi:hypothetical protein